MHKTVNQRFTLIFQGQWKNVWASVGGCVQPALTEDRLKIDIRRKWITAIILA